MHTIINQAIVIFLLYKPISLFDPSFFCTFVDARW